MNQRPEVKEAIARAREHGEDVLAAGCLEIADDGTNDWMERAENKGWEFNGENVQRSKLRIETRLKLLAKWNPKKYGDRIENRLADPEGNALKIVVTGIQPTEENT